MEIAEVIRITHGDERRGASRPAAWTALATRLAPAVLVFLALAPGAQAGVEARCGELGSSCVQSEPMQNNDFPVATVQSGVQHDWSDTATHGLSEWISPVKIRSVDVSDQPAGGVVKAQRVWGNGSGSMLSGYSVQAPCSAVPNAQRMCFRIYKRWSRDFPEDTFGGQCGSGSKEVKNLEAGGGALQGNHDSAFNFRTVTGGASPSCDTAPSVGVGVGDCKDQWCRFEMCVSGANICSTASPVSTQTFAYEVDDKVLRSTGVRGPCANDDNGGSGILSRNPGDNSWTTCTSPVDEQVATDVAYFMIAAWPTDNGQTIGAAKEIEGGGGTSNPPAPAPTPTPPAAPTLLP